MTSPPQSSGICAEVERLEEPAGWATPSTQCLPGTAGLRHTHKLTDRGSTQDLHRFKPDGFPALREGVDLEAMCSWYQLAKRKKIRFLQRSVTGHINPTLGQAPQLLGFFCGLFCFVLLCFVLLVFCLFILRFGGLFCFLKRKQSWMGDGEDLGASQRGNTIKIHCLKK